MPLFTTELETPAAIVDLDRLAQNLDTMAAYCALHGLALRPHVKTHKAPRIAAEQMRLGAVGLTCATPRELEVMSEVSTDLLLAHPPVTWPKIQRVLSIPREVRLTIAVDGAEAASRIADIARDMGRFVGLQVEVDLGMHRMGVPRPDDAVELARRISELDGVYYAGLLFYPGHIREPVERQTALLGQLTTDLGRVLGALQEADLTPPVVSGGSTPIGWRIHEVRGVTEVRPGTYVYNDRTTEALGACSWDDCALTVLATVISTAVPGQAVIDAGSKALGREPMPGPDGARQGFGALLDRPEVVVARMSEEHGILDLSATDWRPRVGEQVRVVPNHVCVVVHLNDTVYGVRDEVVETNWPVTARGRESDRPVWGR
ncbi:MAG TPA: alanine racemase [Gemmatimonadaceae bacterium]|nr:alanine racemase [Gemmatimonadaceae bacterium]